MNDFVLQTLRKGFGEDLEKAEKYYALLSVWNNLGLTQRQIQLLAFAAVNGTISYKASKEEFSRLYNSSSATINNMISDLKEMGLLVKLQGKWKVLPQIELDFSKNVFLGFKLVGNV